MECDKRKKPKIGSFGSGLSAHRPQFPSLKPMVMATMERLAG
jgi:hypothetical protein